MTDTSTKRQSASRAAFLIPLLLVWLANGAVHAEETQVDNLELEFGGCDLSAFLMGCFGRSGDVYYDLSVPEQFEAQVSRLPAGLSVAVSGELYREDIIGIRALTIKDTPANRALLLAKANKDADDARLHIEVLPGLAGLWSDGADLTLSFEGQAMRQISGFVRSDGRFIVSRQCAGAPGGPIYLDLNLAGVRQCWSLISLDAEALALQTPDRVLTLTRIGEAAGSE